MSSETESGERSEAAEAGASNVYAGLERADQEATAEIPQEAVEVGTAIGTIIDGKRLPGESARDTKDGTEVTLLQGGNPGPGVIVPVDRVSISKDSEGDGWKYSRSSRVSNDSRPGMSESLAFKDGKLELRQGKWGESGTLYEYDDPDARDRIDAFVKQLGTKFSKYQAAVDEGAEYPARHFVD